MRRKIKAKAPSPIPDLKTAFWDAEGAEPFVQGGGAGKEQPFLPGPDGKAVHGRKKAQVRKRKLAFQGKGCPLIALLKIGEDANLFFIFFAVKAAVLQSGEKEIDQYAP